MGLYYEPAQRRCGDFVPFSWKGRYHVFYLQEGDWRHVSTADLVSYEDHGVAIPRGEDDAQDAMVATGSVVAHEGRFYAFYCGMNAAKAQAGGYAEVLMRATSDDLAHWVKDESWRMPPDTARYDRAAWRDPLVIWMPQESCYWMLLTAQLRDGPAAALVDARRRGVGCVALYTSQDLDHWESQGPICYPGWYDALECPDLFRMGDWWYLVFSQYRDIWVTRYRMARDPRGPWLVPADDALDGRAFYAAKTAPGPEGRVLFGWLADREGGVDSNAYVWGGSLMAHVLQQRSDGTLAAGPPSSRLAALGADLPPWQPEAAYGVWKRDARGWHADARRGPAYLELGPAPNRFSLRARIRWTPGTGRVGLVYRGQPGLNDGYLLMIEPGRGRLTLDRWLRSWYREPLSRPVRLGAESADLTVMAAGDEIVAYVDDTVALSGRICDLQDGALGLLVAEGGASFEEISIRGG